MVTNLRFSGDTLRIGLDAYPLATARTGIGRYVLELCRQLDLLLPEARFYCYSPSPITADLPSARWIRRIDRHPLMARIGSYWWLKGRVHRWCVEDGVEIFWATRTILPRATSCFKTVTTVHDLNHLIVPRSMPPLTRLAHRLFFARDVRRADVVAVNSSATARRLWEHLTVRADGVVRPGVSRSFTRQERSQVGARLRNLGVERPYVLAVGTLEPRKNLESLITAFLELSNTGRLPGYALIIVGRPGWKNASIHRQLAAPDAKNIRWLGYVADDDLAALYGGADAFVMPSVYEGFGMPVLEARTAGAPVLASDIPELREAGGPDGVYVAPNKEGIMQGLLKILSKKTPSTPPTSMESWETAGTVMAKLFHQTTTQGLGAASPKRAE